jgi:hypothetical protein
LKRKNYRTPWYTTLPAPFANFAITVTELVPDVPVKVPLAPGLASSIPFCAPLTKDPGFGYIPWNAGISLTRIWIDEGGIF